MINKDGVECSACFYEGDTVIVDGALPGDERWYSNGDVGTVSSYMGHDIYFVSFPAKTWAIMGRKIALIKAREEA
jgi:hypothetical protein